MSTIYYIDSENVGDSWIDLLDIPDSRFIVFYTMHSPHIAFDQVIRLMNAANKPEFIECHEGNNGLDFQLVSYMGYELHANSSNEMIIVSNDTGFDAVVYFWTKRDMQVKRMPTSDIASLQPMKNKEPVSDYELTTDSLSEELDDKVFGVDRKELDTIINCVGSKEHYSIYLACVQFYGSKKGNDIYQQLKKEGFVAPSVPWDKKTRMKKFIDLIIQNINTQNISIPQSFPGFIMNNVVEDKKVMVNLINKSFGKTDGMMLNKMFKLFYETLSKIKKS